MKQKVIAMAALAVAAASSMAHAADDPKAKTAQAGMRLEHDLLGDKQVPAAAYYGVQTARALENFQISGVSMDHYPEFVDGFAIVKLAAARANTQVGAMKPERLAAIEKAYQAILAGQVSRSVHSGLVSGRRRDFGKYERQRSLANIGLELTGHKKGEYQYLEPHDDLNMSQSTNDSYPTAIKVAFLLRNDKLMAELTATRRFVSRQGKRSI